MESRILDNKQMGSVGEALQDNLNNNSKLSIISAYFTIYAYQHLKKELSKIDSMRLLFSEPNFLKEKKELKREYQLIGKEKSLSGDKFEIKLKNELNQTEIAKECAEWIRKKVEIKAYDSKFPLPQKLFHINNKDKDISITGSSNFSSSGLGFVNSNTPEMNIYTDDTHTTKQMLDWFNSIWNDETQVKDVKQAVLEKLEEVYKENCPEFVVV